MKGLEHIQLCSVVYCIYSADKRYIGSSVNIRARLLTHIRLLRRGKHFNPKLLGFFNKYGEGSLTCCIIEVCDRSSVRKREQVYLDELFLEPKENVFNITRNAKNALDDPEMLARLLNSPNRHKSIEALRKAMLDPVNIQKSSERFRSLQKDENFIARRREATKLNNSTEKHKKLLEQLWAESKKKVRCVETKQEFESASAAARWVSENGYKCNPNGVTNSCYNKINSYGGYHWRWATDEDDIIYTKRYRVEPVVMEATGMAFASVKEAINYLKSVGFPKATSTCICGCCSGKRKSAYGSSWKYA
jgi:group I intron endonuclease